jgi:hypothetical protein
MYVQFEGNIAPLPWLVTGALLAKVEDAMCELDNAKNRTKTAVDGSMKHIGRAVAVLR